MLQVPEDGSPWLVETMGIMGESCMDSNDYIDVYVCVCMCGAWDTKRI